MKTLVIVIAGAALAAFSGCTTGAEGTRTPVRVMTPFGVYDTTTTGPMVIDTRPLFDYMLRDKQLEK